MKIFKISVSAAVMLEGLAILYKMLIGRVDFIVEPKHIAVMVISLVCYGIGCWHWITED